MPSLQSQLQQLSVQTPIALLKTHRRPSVLYDLTKAKLVAPQLVLSQGRQAFHQLLLSCSWLQPFTELFGEQALGLNRNLLAQQAQAELSSQLESLLMLLGLYLRSDTCLKVLQVLLAIYQVHVFQGEQLLAFNLHHICHPNFVLLIRNLHQEYGLSNPILGVQELLKVERHSIADALKVAALTGSRLALLDRFARKLAKQLDQPEDLVLGHSPDPRDLPFSFYARLRIYRCQHTRNQQQELQLLFKDSLRLLKTDNEEVASVSLSMFLSFCHRANSEFRNQFYQRLVEKAKSRDQPLLRKAILHCRQHQLVERAVFLQTVKQIDLTNQVSSTHIKVFLDLLSLYFGKKADKQLAHAKAAIQSAAKLVPENSQLKKSRALRLAFYGQVLQFISKSPKMKQELAIQVGVALAQGLVESAQQSRKSGHIQFLAGSVSGVKLVNGIVTLQAKEAPQAGQREQSDQQQYQQAKRPTVTMDLIQESQILAALLAKDLGEESSFFCARLAEATDSGRVSLSRNQLLQLVKFLAERGEWRSLIQLLPVFQKLPPEQIQHQFGAFIGCQFQLTQPVFRQLLIRLLAPAKESQHYFDLIERTFAKLAEGQTPETAALGLRTMKRIMTSLAGQSKRFTRKRLVRLIFQGAKPLLLLAGVGTAEQHRVTKLLEGLLQQFPPEVHFGLMAGLLEQGRLQEKGFQRLTGLLSQKLIERGSFWLSLAKLVRANEQWVKSLLEQLYIPIPERLSTGLNVEHKSLAAVLLKGGNIKDYKRVLLLTLAMFAQLLSNSRLIELFEDQLADPTRNQHFLAGYSSFYQNLLNYHSCLIAGNPSQQVVEKELQFSAGLKKRTAQLLANLTALLPDKHFEQACVEMIPRNPLIVQFIGLNLPASPELLPRLLRHLPLDHLDKELTDYSLDVLELIQTKHKVALKSLEEKQLMKVVLQDKSLRALQCVLAMQFTPQQAILYGQALQSHVLSAQAGQTKLAAAFFLAVGKCLPNFPRSLKKFYKFFGFQKAAALNQQIRTLGYGFLQRHLQNLTEHQHYCAHLMSLLSQSVSSEQADLELVVQLYSKLFKKYVQRAIPNDSFTSLFSQGFTNFMLKGTSLQLKRAISTLLQNRRKPLNESESLARSSLAAQLHCGLLEKAGATAVPLCQLGFQELIAGLDLVEHLGKDQRVRVEEQELMTQCAKSWLRFVFLLCEKDHQQQFMDQMKFEKLEKRIVRVVGFRPNGSYLEFISQHLCPAVISLLSGQSNDLNLKSFNSLLLSQRFPDHTGTVGALTVLVAALDGMGDRYAFLTADILQFLSQLVNSSMTVVRQKAKLAISRLSTLAGEDLMALVRKRTR